MSRLATARSAIFDALVPVMGEGHVHRTVPAQVVSPCCWIERPRLRTVASRSIEILATFPVAFVLDGDGEQQQIDFDELIAAAWDALTGRTMAPTAAFPRATDTGGPVASAYFIDVDATILTRTLCDPTMNGAPAHV